MKMKPALSRFLKDLDKRDEERRSHLIKTLKPPQFDEEEEKKLKEKDKNWFGKVHFTIVSRCTHKPFVILSSGVKQCLSVCGRFWVPERLRDLYPPETYPNAIFVED